MATTTKPTGHNATATPAFEALASGIFDLTDYECVGKAEGVLNLASWMFGAITTLDTIRNKAAWCNRLADDLTGQGIAINGDIFTIEHATAMQSMLMGAATACRELLGMGVEIDPHGRYRLGEYLQDKAPKRRIECALQTGWAGTDYKAFVLPDTVIGPRAASVAYQSGERGSDEYATAGTLAGWQAGICWRWACSSQ